VNAMEGRKDYDDKKVCIGEQWQPIFFYSAACILVDLRFFISPQFIDSLKNGQSDKRRYPTRRILCLRNVNEPSLFVIIVLAEWYTVIHRLMLSRQLFFFFIAIFWDEK